MFGLPIIQRILFLAFFAIGLFLTLGKRSMFPKGAMMIMVGMGLGIVCEILGIGQQIIWAVIIRYDSYFELGRIIQTMLGILVTVLLLAAWILVLLGALSERFPAMEPEEEYVPDPGGAPVNEV